MELSTFYLAPDEADARVVAVAAALRESGSVEVDATGRALKKQLRAAEKAGARFAVIIEASSPERLKSKTWQSPSNTMWPDRDVAKLPRDS